MKLIQKILSVFGLKIVRLTKYNIPVVPFDLLDILIKSGIKTSNESLFYLNLVRTSDDILSPFNLAIQKNKIDGCTFKLKEVPKIIPEYSSCEEFIQNLISPELSTTKKCTSKDEFKYYLKNSNLILGLCIGNENPQLLNSIFKFRLYPKIICFDHTDMDQKHHYLAKMLLLDNGYRFIDTNYISCSIRYSDGTV